MNDYIIEKMSWLTLRPGLAIPRSFLIRRFWVLIDFLQRNDLTNRIIAESEDLITDESQLLSSDLNERGKRLMKAAYEKYSNSCKPPQLQGISDRVLVRELNRLGSD